MVEFQVHITEVNTSDSRRVNHTCWFEVNHVLEEESAQCQLIVASQLGRILPNCNQERGEDSASICLSVCPSAYLPVCLKIHIKVLTPKHHTFLKFRSKPHPKMLTELGSTSRGSKNNHIAIHLNKPTCRITCTVSNLHTTSSI